jgi:Ca2+-binding EF-hand superfamily protein
MKTLGFILRIALGSLALLFTATMATAEESAGKERKPSKETLAKYDTNKDGALDDTEMAAWKADIAAKAKATKEENLAKYDANKDGKLDETEKAARKADEDAEKAAKKAEKEARKEKK